MNILRIATTRVRRQVITVDTAIISALTSLVSINNATVASGSTRTITVTGKDALGNAMTSGGSVVVVSLGVSIGGVATGTLANSGVCTDVGDGTYTCIITGVIVGTAATIYATINGASVSTTLPTLTVTPGPVSAVTSVITVSPSSRGVGGANATVTLTGMDAAGNLVPTGTPTVVFTKTTGGGVSTVTLGATVVEGGGIWSASITPGAAGTATTLAATIDGTPTTLTGSFTVTAVSAFITIDPQVYTDTTDLRGASFWAGDTSWGISPTGVGDGAYLKTGITGYSGRTKEIRIDLRDRTGEGASRCHDYSPSELNVNLGANYSELWFEAYVRFDTGFETVTNAFSCVGISAPAYKTFHQRMTSGAAWEYVVGNPDHTNIDMNIIGVDEHNYAVPNMFLDGTVYHQMRVHVKISTIGSGICIWNINDVSYVNRSSLTTSAALIYGIGLGRNMNQGPDHAQSLGIGYAQFFNVDPGWGF